MGRILIQSRRAVVPNIANVTIADAALAAWNGFPESATQSMVLGCWMRERIKSNTWPTYVGKGSWQVRGMYSSIDPWRNIYTVFNKTGANISDSGISPRFAAMRWTHIVLLITSTGIVSTYYNGNLLRRHSFGAGWNAGEFWTTAGTSNLAFNNNAHIATCAGIFASTDDPNRILITPEQIYAMYRTGAIPNNIIYWPMDEGAGTVANAYVNGALVPALAGSLANSWVLDSPFN